MIMCAVFSSKRHWSVQTIYLPLQLERLFLSKKVGFSFAQVHKVLNVCKSVFWFFCGLPCQLCQLCLCSIVVNWQLYVWFFPLLCSLSPSLSLSFCVKVCVWSSITHTHCCYFFYSFQIECAHWRFSFFSFICSQFLLFTVWMKKCVCLSKPNFKC